MCYSSQRATKNRLTEAEEDAALLESLTHVEDDASIVHVQPECIKFGTMRSYQVEGMAYFISLYRKGITGGILADEMVLFRIIYIYIFISVYLYPYRCKTGHNRCSKTKQLALILPFIFQGLGKTLQTIAIMGYLKEHNLTRGVHLVIIPLSVLRLVHHRLALPSAALYYPTSTSPPPRSIREFEFLFLFYV